MMLQIMNDVTDGLPYVYCSATVNCNDTNSVCFSGICMCDLNFRNIGGTCRECNDNNIINM